MNAHNIRTTKHVINLATIDRINITMPSKNAQLAAIMELIMHRQYVPAIAQFNKHFPHVNPYTAVATMYKELFRNMMRPR